MVFVAVRETLLEQMEEGVQFAAKYGAKVYVAANMVMHEEMKLVLVSGSVNCVISGLQQLSYLTQPWLWLQQLKHQALKSTFLPKPVPLTIETLEVLERAGLSRFSAWGFQWKN